VLTVKNYEKGLWFKKEELNGVPEEFFKGFKYDEKKRKYFVNCSGRDDLGTDYPIVKKYCEVAKTREAITKYNEEGVGVKNIKKLAEIFKLRNEIVKILGYKTWADLAVEDEMMNKPKDIKKFLEDLLKKLTPGYVKYLKKVESTLKAKKEKLTTASFTYGEQLMKAQDLPVKEEEYKPYFELENVMKVLFNTWEQYFNIKTKVIEGKKVMHPDTTVLEFSDSKSGQCFQLVMVCWHTLTPAVASSSPLFANPLSKSGGQNSACYRACITLMLALLTFFPMRTNSTR
jgi:Zn-dependent oligopeptidase